MGIWSYSNEAYKKMNDTLSPTGLYSWQAQNSITSSLPVLCWCTAQYSSNCCIQLTKQQSIFSAS